MIAQHSPQAIKVSIKNQCDSKGAAPLRIISQVSERTNSDDVDVRTWIQTDSPPHHGLEGGVSRRCKAIVIAIASAVGDDDNDGS
jgi:hypothetical protein